VGGGNVVCGGSVSAPRRLLVSLAGLAVIASPGAAGARAVLVRASAKKAVIVYLDSVLRQPVTAPNAGPLAFSGDGRLISIGGTITSRGISLPAPSLVWAPTGERAAAVTAKGGVVAWTPAGKRWILRDGFGADAVAWSRDGSLAVGRRNTLWVWRAGRLRRLVGPRRGEVQPLPVAWSGGGVLWWAYPGSGSIAADGVALYDGTRRLGFGLMYRDYVAVCGRHVAFVAGRDRYAMHRKSIVFDGRDVSHDPSRSWVSPSCASDGRLVAAASANVVPKRIGREQRAIWQLLPTRRRLTRPPAGWTDEDPQLLPSGGVVFVRTRWTSRKLGTEWQSTQRGDVDLLANGKLRTVAHVAFTEPSLGTEYPLDYYGHYDWTHFVAVAP
jgi:hypothetical protein